MDRVSVAEVKAHESRLSSPDQRMLGFMHRAQSLSGLPSTSGASIGSWVTVSGAVRDYSTLCLPRSFQSLIIDLFFPMRLS